MGANGFPVYVVRTAKFFLLYGLLFLLLLLNLSHLPLMDAPGIRPAFLLIGVYFWSVTKPSLLPLPLVFFFGLLLDIVSGSFVGLNTLCLMLVTLFARSQRRFLVGQPWQVVWIGFCVAALIVESFQALFYWVASGKEPVIGNVLFGVLASVTIYPLFLPLWGWVGRLISLPAKRF